MAAHPTRKERESGRGNWWVAGVRGPSAARLDSPFGLRSGQAQGGCPYAGVARAGKSDLS
jgi:hypothetical protein